MAKIMTEFFEADYCVILRFTPLSEFIDCPVQLLVQYGTNPDRYVKLEDFPSSLIDQIRNTTHPAIPMAFCNAIGLQSPLMARVHYRDTLEGMVFLGHFQKTRFWTPVEESIFKEVALPIGNTLFQSDLLLQEQLARETARIANERKTLYLTSISHELRAPLHNILAGVALMRDEMLGPMNDKQKEYLTLLHQNADHLLTMINELLDYSKIEAGKLTISYQSVSIADLVEDTVFLVNNLYKTEQRTLQVLLDENLAEFFECDPLRVKQILLNFLSNAHQFTPPETRVVLSVTSDERTVSFSVQDFGPGILPEDMTRIFEPFEQLCPRRGTGLGLPIAQKLAQCHQGHISVNSIPGEGSEFVLTLPLMAQ